jgi:hypothetical protein
MKPRALNLRIARLVVDAPVAEGVTLDALAHAIRSELASRMLEGPTESPRASRRQRTTAPLAGMIADRIAGRLGAMNTGIGLKSRGGGNGAV